MTLSVRVIPSPEPGQVDRAPTFIVPLARWYPGRLAADEFFLPVEAYDLVTKQFVRLPREAGR